jgi:hypothetical protein
VVVGVVVVGVVVVGVVVVGVVVIVVQYISIHTNIHTHTQNSRDSTNTSNRLYN